MFEIVLEEKSIFGDYFVGLFFILLTVVEGVSSLAQLAQLIDDVGL